MVDEYTRCAAKVDSLHDEYAPGQRELERDLMRNAGMRHD